MSISQISQSLLPACRQKTILLVRDTGHAPCRIIRFDTFVPDRSLATEAVFVIDIPGPNPDPTAALNVRAVPAPAAK